MLGELVRWVCKDGWLVFFGLGRSFSSLCGSRCAASWGNPNAGPGTRVLCIFAGGVVCLVALVVS